MRPAEYDAFTQALRAGLELDDRVVGLVAVGSMAARDYQPDEWSDHDFFVITATGVQEELREEVSWLPHAERIAHWHRETEHGLQVFYEDGHLLEFAVFDLPEIGLAGVNRYRVLLDRGGVEARVREVAAATAARRLPSDEHEFGKFLGCVLVGAGRDRRGESLSGGMFVKDLALRFLVVLLGRAIPAANAGLLDDLDPLRRFDLVHPELAAELVELTRRETVDAASGLLALAERELRHRRPDLAWHALEIVRARIGAGTDRHTLD
ncbi:MAG TPA: hypothetical protein VFJ78_06030 [Gaiellaceae bacterium]|nr:hypothetical protein [Gaiellaceae bacterium]